MNFLLHLDLSLLHIALQTMEYIYFGIFIVCAASVYYVLVQRVGEEMPRSTVDKIFFLMLGVASLIWFLSTFTPAA